MKPLNGHEAHTRPANNIKTFSTASPQIDLDYVSSDEASDGAALSSLGQSFDQTNISKTTSSPKKKLQNLANRTKDKTVRLFNTSDGQPRAHIIDSEDGEALRAMRTDPAFHPNQLSTKHRSEKKLAVKALGNLQAIATGVLHPKQGVKGKATRSTAGRLSKIDRPYLSKNADLEFLEAHDDLHRAESSASSRLATSEDEGDLVPDNIREKVQRLEAQRESLRAAYTTSRLVHRVRVVPKLHIDAPEIEAYIENSEAEQKAYNWLRWLGCNLLFYTQSFSAQYIDDFDDLPFDIESLKRQVERIVIASAPWQAFFMDVRSVYRWESPAKTTKWLALYIYLWYTQHIMGFLYLYIIYVVVMNRYFPTSIDSLRESMLRAQDSRSTAHKIGELADKHGRHHWLEPFLDDLGPFIQLQLHDVANMLEVFANFHAWTYPRKTTASLIFFASCLAISLFTDMAFCMKIFWFVAGGSFFVCWPIASRYPKYRYLVSPFKWILWDVPTDAEWSFSYLRRMAQLARQQLIECKIEQLHQTETDHFKGSPPSRRADKIPFIMVEGLESSDDEVWYSAASASDILGDSDIMAYRARWHGNVGRLIIYSGGVRFVRSLKRSELWKSPFLEIAELRKKQSSRASKLSMMGQESLEIKLVDGTKLDVDGLKDRDSAFNTIIGCSGLQWQSLQPKVPRQETELI